MAHPDTGQKWITFLQSSSNSGIFITGYTTTPQTRVDSLSGISFSCHLCSLSVIPGGVGAINDFLVIWRRECVFCVFSGGGLDRLGLDAMFVLLYYLVKWADRRNVALAVKLYQSKSFILWTSGSRPFHKQLNYPFHVCTWSNLVALSAHPDWQAHESQTVHSSSSVFKTQGQLGWCWLP